MRRATLRRFLGCACVAALTAGLFNAAPAAQAGPSNIKVTVPIKRLPVTGLFYPKWKDFGDTDREFDGNGPDVVATATLNGELTSRKLTVTLCMTATETEDNWTKAEGCETYLLYMAPPGECIGVLSHGTSDEVKYTDDDHDNDVFNRFGSPNFVQRWEFVGDTVYENDAGDRTGVYIETFPIFFTTGPGGCQ